MKIQLLHSKVHNLSFKMLKSNDGPLKEKSFSVDYSINYDSKKDNIFAVQFDLNIEHPGEFSLNLDYISWFLTSNPIDTDFKDSDFPSINAPAIAFPFLRSFVSMLTLNSGFSPAILPSINFIEIHKEKHSLSEPQ